MLYFTIQNRLQAGTSKVSEAAGARWRFYPRISSDILGLWSNRFSIGGSTSGIFRANLDLQDFVAGAVFGEVGGWLDWLHALEMTFESDADHWWHSFCVAGAVFGEVAGWLYLLHALEMTFHMRWGWTMTFILRGRRSIWWGCAHWKWRLICVADHWWHSFCVAGAVFGKVGGWLFVAGALLRDILGDSRSAKCCILQYKIVSKLGRVRSPKRRVRDDDFILGYRRISSDYGRIVFLLAEALQGFSAQILTFKISWQAQYLVRLEGDFTCSTHWKGRLKVTQIIDDIHFAWQAQYLLSLKGDFTCSTQWKWRFICDADERWHSFCVAGAVFGEVGRWPLLRRAL